MPPPTTRGLCAAAATIQERLVVKDGNEGYADSGCKLDYAEAQDDYVALASQGKKHLKQQTIAAWKQASKPGQLRAHPPLLHRELERVVRIEPYGKDSRLAILTDGTRLPVAAPATPASSPPRRTESNLCL